MIRRESHASRCVSQHDDANFEVVHSEVVHSVHFRCSSFPGQDREGASVAELASGSSILQYSSW